MLDEVVITGIGMVDSCGITPTQCWDSLIHDKSQPVNQEPKWPSVIQKRVFEVPGEEGFRIEGLNDREQRLMPIVQKASIHTIQLALDMAGLSGNAYATCTYGSLAGPQELLEFQAASMFDGKVNVNPFKILYGGKDWTNGFLSTYFKLHGPSISTTGACASGLLSIRHAAMLLQTDPDLEYSVAGGSDFGDSAFWRYYFQQLRALSMEDSDDCSRPFDKARNGFILGDGACAFVVERKKDAIARNATILAEISSFGAYTEADHPTDPDINAVGGIKTMTQAIKRAGIQAGDIDYINAHGTSTPAGDEAEALAIHTVFGSDTPVSSNKGHIGHTMAASGLLETAYSIMAMQHGMIPHTGHLRDPLRDDVNFVMHKPMDKPLRYILKNSFGFSGRCVSMVLKNPNL